uniref:Uncharacterized protein n=1 Tax=Strigamia maritima TaxID=126957 RepID=T1JP81_STRMM
MNGYNERGEDYQSFHGNNNEYQQCSHRQMSVDNGGIYPWMMNGNPIKQVQTSQTFSASKMTPQNQVYTLVEST